MPNGARRAAGGVVPTPDGVTIPTRGLVGKGKTTWKKDSESGTRWRPDWARGIPGGIGGAAGMQVLRRTQWRSR